MTYPNRARIEADAYEAKARVRTYERLRDDLRRAYRDLDEILKDVAYDNVGNAMDHLWDARGELLAAIDAERVWIPEETGE